MARPLRIEYAGAKYHVMARGNQGRSLFRDDEDRHGWLATLGEACAKTGWRVHAYVLMNNHYHLLLETPEANLVTGMKWLQGTYTQRYNRRHDVSGHLFQGRYKAVAVEPDNAGYLEAVSTYIHLNPARAGLIAIGREPLKQYRWSSYPWYLKPTGNGPAWLERERVLGALKLKPNDGRGYGLYLESRVLELGLRAGRRELEQQWQALRRGWYVGGESFGAKLREQAGRLLSAQRHESHSGPVKREHGEQAAEQLLGRALVALGLTEADLASKPKVTPAKAALARWLREQTTVSLRWVSARLNLGHYSNAGRSPRKMRPADVRQLKQCQRQLESVAVSPA